MRCEPSGNVMRFKFSGPGSGWDVAGQVGDRIRQSPPCSRLLSRICAATISSGRFPVSSTRCRCATGVGEGMSRNPGDEAAGARRLLARLAEEGSALRQVRVGYLLAIRSAASGQGPRVPKQLVEFCLRQDWLEQSGGDLVLSQAGRARLRRSQTEGDPIREQHQLRAVTLKEIDGTRRPMLVNEAESPLGWLKSRKSRSGRPLISELNMKPASVSVPILVRPSQPEGDGELVGAGAFRAIAAGPRSTRRLARRGHRRQGARHARARCWSFPSARRYLLRLKGLEEAERSHDWPQRAGKVVLQLGLTRLARHYGLDVPSDLPRRRKGIRHWGSEDYRPTLDSWRGSGDQ